MESSASMFDIIAKYNSLDAAAFLIVETTLDVRRACATKFSFCGHSKDCSGALFAAFQIGLSADFASGVRPFNASLHMKRMLFQSDGQLFSSADTDIM
jgi:hypothetical protein